MILPYIKDMMVKNAEKINENSSESWMRNFGQRLMTKRESALKMNDVPPAISETVRRRDRRMRILMLVLSWTYDFHV